MKRIAILCALALGGCRAEDTRSCAERFGEQLDAADLPDRATTSFVTFNLTQTGRETIDALSEGNGVDTVTFGTSDAVPERFYDDDPGAHGAAFVSDDFVVLRRVGPAGSPRGILTSACAAVPEGGFLDRLDLVEAEANGGLRTTTLFEDGYVVRITPTR